MNFFLKPSTIIFCLVLLIGILNIMPSQNTSLWLQILILIVSAFFIALIVEWILSLIKFPEH
ncbi:hypothetical protein DES34_10885 [Brevibacillus brevis]|nr:hypothetical protein DES34_10885 [Brevibacillus brevis]VEF90919.1 Uncharacterised protein [Brevibacillus brevis]